VIFEGHKKCEDRGDAFVVSEQRDTQNVVCVVKGAKSDTVSDWIGEIRKVWARGASSTMDLARVLSAAKNRLQQH